MKKVFAGILLIFLLAGSLTACGKGPEAAMGIYAFSTSASANEILASVKAGGFVVFEEFRCTAGDGLWQEFYRDVSRGRPASVNCAYYYTIDKERMTEELYEAQKEQYPRIFLGCLQYDGQEFTITVRQSTEENPETNKQYKYLMKYTGAPTSPNAVFSSYTYYVLVNDDSVTWEEIEWGMYSSQSGDWIEHDMVYMNHVP